MDQLNYDTHLGFVGADAVTLAFNSCVAKLLECLEGEVRPEVLQSISKN